MLKKRKVRELAMQILFLWDTQDDADRALADQVVMDGADDAEIRSAALEMAGKTWEQRKAIDERVERIAPQWPPRRQPGVDRNLIRLAVWEMTSTDTPPKVVIDEAIELAKHFSTEQSPAFVNGVLDAVLKEHAALVGKVDVEKPSS
jgi:N utilization substance protein B